MLSEHQNQLFIEGECFHYASSIQMPLKISHINPSHYWEKEKDLKCRVAASLLAIKVLIVLLEQFKKKSWFVFNVKDTHLHCR